MNLNKYIKGAALAFAALALGSCASDYLDTPTHGSVPAEDICKTPETARQAMLGVFGRGMAAPWSSFTPAQALWQGETGLGYYYGEIPSSDCYVNFIYDQAPNWVVFYSMEDTYLTSGRYVWNSPMWVAQYAYIAQVNDILSHIDATDTQDEESLIALRDFTKAQALTMRAYSYWRLLSTYAPRWEDSNGGQTPCLVLRVSPEQPKDTPVSSMLEVLTQVYEDLDNALQLFESAGKSFRQYNFEIDKNVAYGVYARVAALRHDWATCKTMAHNARQGKRMPTETEAFSGYMSYNQNEWMWAPSFEQIDNFIYGNWCTFMCCNSYGALNDRYTNSINLDLYNLLPKDDLRSNWWLTHDKMAGMKTAMFYENNMVNGTTGAFKNNKLLTAAFTWLNEHKPSTVKTNGAYETATSSDKTTAIIRDGAQIKFWCNGLQGQDNLAQIPFMRAAEMYLYEAEACAMLGESTEAQNLLVEINKNFNPGYTCSLTGQELIDEVRLYRRIELWGEGFNWFDLKRWNLPMKRTAWEAKNPKSGNIPAGLACDVPPTQNLGWRYAIPLGEMNYNEAITVPVPGRDAPTE